MTTIEWTQRPGTRGETWNPIRARNRTTGGLGHFCEHVSEGCRNCYAERLQPRFRNRIRYARQDRDKVEIFLDEAKLAAPLGWRKPRTVFVCSMTDLFGEWVEEAWLDAMFTMMALTPRHTYQVLTKRPERMRDYLSRFKQSPYWDDFVTRDGKISNDLRGGEPLFNPDCWPLPNVWLGVSVEDQATAELRIPLLLETPAALRFVSYEPALEAIEIFSINGPVDVPDGMDSPLHWIIAGGESGPNARPADPEWFRDVAMQCALAKVPFFFKQWGGATHGAGGRLLDGREYNEWPR